MDPPEIVDMLTACPIIKPLRPREALRILNKSFAPGQIVLTFF